MKTPRILIVEDEAIVAMDLRNRLASLGYEVAGTVADGSDAVALAEETKPDLVLLDFQLRGALDGITAARQLRERARLPVVFLTAHAGDAALQRARLAEPYGFILKPFEDRELKTVIEIALYKHQAEQQLAASERRYAATLRSIADGVIAADSAGRVTFMNPAAEQATGWKLSEAAGRPLAEIFRVIDEATRHPEENVADQVRRRGVAAGLSNHALLVRRDGTEIPIDDCASPIFDSAGAVTGLVLVFRDVSEHRRAEAAQKESHHQQRAILDTIPDPAWLKNPEGRFLAVNRAWCSFFGLEEAAAVGKTDMELFPAEIAESFRASDLAVLASGRPARQEEAVPDRRRRISWFETSKAPLVDEKGVVIGVAGIARDFTKRKRTEEALQLTQFAVDTAADAIFWLKPDASIAYVNGAACRLLGYTREELLGLTAHNLNSDHPKPVWPEYWAELKRKGSLVSEAALLAKDGRAVTVEITANYLEFGDAAYNCSFVHDVTHRKQAERQIRSLSRFPAENPNPVLRFSADGTLLYANDAARPMLRCWACETGQRLPDEWVARVTEAFASCTQPEFEIACGDRVYSLVLAPIPAENDVNAYGKDITLRKQAEEALRRQAGRLKLLSELDRAILAAQSPTGIAESALLRLRELIPYQRASVRLFDSASATSTPLAAVASDRSRVVVGTSVPMTQWDTALVNEARPVIVAGADVPADPAAPPETADAERRLSSLHVPLLVKEAPIGALVLTVDRAEFFSSEAVEVAGEVANQLAIAIHQARLSELTRSHAQELEQRVRERTAEIEAARRKLEEEIAEHHLTEEALHQRTADLEASNRQLEAFSYSVSHDLRAPLRAVDGFSRIVMEEYATTPPEQLQHYLQRIRENAQRMGQLIDDLLAFSRLSRQPLRRVTVDPANLARQCLKDLQPELQGRRVEIKIGELPACEADPSLVRQVLANLLSNALKYSRSRDPAVIEVGSLLEAGQCTYFVRDNGVGFDVRYAKKLFGVFQRLHRAEEYEGTGVGLAIVQRIVHRHGGSVWAEAALDKGAAFYFTLSHGRQP